MKKIEISIISPVYNTEKFICNFIKSINNQTFKNFELILVNDGTLDDSIILARKELEKTNICYKVIDKENGGQSSARNLGIKNAIGNYVVLLDSDDTIQKNYLENMISIIKKTNSQICICDINRVTHINVFEESNHMNEFDVKNGKDFFVDFFMHKIEIGPYSLMIERNLLKKFDLTFNEKSRYSEEFIFITKLLYNSQNVVHLRQKLYNYCLRKGSVSTNAKIDAICNGFSLIKENSKIYRENDSYCSLYNKYAHARWIIATARFSSKYLRYKDYNFLLKRLNYKQEIKKLNDFPEFKIRLAAFILNFSSFFAYIIFKGTN